MANKLLGQHFLRNAAVAEKIVRAVAPQRGEVIFEVGMGHGELTRPLARACADAHAKLFSLEKDRALVDAAMTAEPAAGPAAVPAQGVEIVQGDALEFFASERFVQETAGNTYKVVGNIPYYLTGRLLRIMNEAAHRPARCVFMVQKEVAERLTAQPPRMNRLAASVQFSAEPTIIAAVPRENFQPVPEVDSAVVVLNAKLDDTKPDVRDSADPGAGSSAPYYAAVHALFAQPRKTVLNNIAASSLLTAKGTNKQMIEEDLVRTGLNPAARPQNLSIDDIMKIARIFFTNVRR